MFSSSREVDVILHPEDVHLFYKLMWGVQYYCNHRTGTFKEMRSADAYAHLPSDKKLKLREILWEQPALMDDYIQENPDAFSNIELEIVRGWRKYFIKGTFYMFKHLKKGTIFIGDNDKVYSVSGLVTPMDEIVPGYALPRLGETVLLPFKDTIVYDGLFSSYDMTFGGNIRANLNRIYQVAKHKERIITSLASTSIPPTSKNRPLSSRVKPNLAEISALLVKIKGDTPTQNVAISLARASLDLAAAAANGEAIAQYRRKVRRASTRLEKLLEFEEEE